MCNQIDTYTYTIWKGCIQSSMKLCIPYSILVSSKNEDDNFEHSWGTYFVFASGIISSTTT